MNEETSTKEFAGHKIFCRHWKSPSDNPKCLVFICHGYAEHCGRYGEVVELLNKENIYVFANDHVGHGKSSGRMGWIENYNNFVVPMKMHIEETAARFPGKKVVIFGHSMGGLIAARAVQLNPSLAHALILDAPFFGPPDIVPRWQIKLGCFLARFAPSIPIAKLDSSTLTHVKSVIDEIENDPLVFQGSAAVKMAKESFDTQKETMANAKLVTLPLLVCHGDADRICPISASEAFYNQSSSSDKTFKKFEGAYHILHSELDEYKLPFFKVVVEWINAHC